MLGANDGVVRRHPSNKQTGVGAQCDVVDVEPDTIKTLGKVGVTSGLGGRMIAIVVLLIVPFLVCVLFVCLRTVLRVVLIIIIVGDGVQQRALLEAWIAIPAYQRFVPSLSN